MAVPSDDQMKRIAAEMTAALDKQIYEMPETLSGIRPSGLPIEGDPIFTATGTGTIATTANAEPFTVDKLDEAIAIMKGTPHGAATTTKPETLTMVKLEEVMEGLHPPHGHDYDRNWMHGISLDDPDTHVESVYHRAFGGSPDAVIPTGVDEYCMADLKTTQLLYEMFDAIPQPPTVWEYITAAWHYFTGNVAFFFKDAAQDYRNTRAKYGRNSRHVDIETTPWTEFQD